MKRNLNENAPLEIFAHNQGESVFIINHRSLFCHRDSASVLNSRMIIDTHIFEASGVATPYSRSSPSWRGQYIIVITEGDDVINEISYRA